MQQQPALPTETCAGFVRWAMVEAQQFQQIGSSCEGQVANISFPFQEGVESAKQKPCRKVEGPALLPTRISDLGAPMLREGGRSNPDPCAGSRTSELN